MPVTITGDTNFLAGNFDRVLLREKGKTGREFGRQIVREQKLDLIAASKGRMNLRSPRLKGLGFTISKLDGDLFIYDNFPGARINETGGVQRGKPWLTIRLSETGIGVDIEEENKKGNTFISKIGNRNVVFLKNASKRRIRRGRKVGVGLRGAGGAVAVAVLQKSIKYRKGPSLEKKVRSMSDEYARILEKRIQNG